MHDVLNIVQDDYTFCCRLIKGVHEPGGGAVNQRYIVLENQRHIVYAMQTDLVSI
jgi:hypothetical protein